VNITADCSLFQCTGCGYTNGCILLKPDVIDDTLNRRLTECSSALWQDAHVTSYDYTLLLFNPQKIVL